MRRGSVNIKVEGDMLFEPRTEREREREREREDFSQVSAVVLYHRCGNHASETRASRISQKLEA